MRAASRSSLTAIIVLALLEPAVAQPRQSARARMVAEIMAATRCNLATTYRLRGRENLNVRMKPKEESPVVARLGEGRIVYVCDQDGEWLNVYFGGVEGPCFRTYEWGLRFREARKCRSGWVRQNWVNILSG
jgi:SH3-like domain-containing protein